MSLAPEVIQKVNVLALARLADRTARVGSHVAGRPVSYGAVRGAVHGAATGAVRGALQGLSEMRRVRQFRNGVRTGYSNARYALRRFRDAQETNARLFRAAIARSSRAGRLGHAIGTRAANARSSLGAASRTLVRAFTRLGRRVASYWRTRT